MKTSSILTIVAAIAAVAVAAVIASGGGGKAKPDSSGRAPVAPAPAGSQQLSFVVSPEKEQLLKAVVAKFNASATQVAGKRACSLTCGRPPARSGGGC